MSRYTLATALLLSCVVIAAAFFPAVQGATVSTTITSTTSTTSTNAIGNAPVPKVVFTYSSTRFSLADFTANITESLPSLMLNVAGQSCPVSFGPAIFSHNSTAYSWALSSLGPVTCNGDAITPALTLFVINSTSTPHQKEIIVQGQDSQAGASSVSATVAFPLALTGMGTESVTGATLRIGDIGYNWTALSAFSPVFSILTNTLSVTTQGSTAATSAYVLDPTTIGTSNSNGNCGGTGCDNQLKLWESNGYYWFFYTDNAHFGVRSCLISTGNCGTSSANWGSFQSVTANANIGECSTAVNATYSATHIMVVCGTGNNNFALRQELLGSSGTISLVYALTVTPTLQSSSGYPYILYFSNTTQFVALKTYDGTNEHVEVWGCVNAACGTPANWSNLLDENDGFGNNDAHPTLNAVRTGGSTYVAVSWGYDGYTINHAMSIRWTTNYGTSWHAAINSACNIDAMGYSQVVQTNGTLYTMAIQSGGTGCNEGYIDFIRWDFGSASITYETKNFQAAPSGGPSGVGLSSNRGASVSFVYESSSTTINYKASTNGGNSFGSATAISTAESFGSLDFTPTISPTCDASNNVLVGWMSGSGTPFNVRFALYTGCTAASVTQAIKVTVSPAGSASATIGISGCSVSNSTFTATTAGYTHTYPGMTASCTVTLSNPSPGLHSRYCWNISPKPTCSTGSITFTTCGTGACTLYSNTTYYQLGQNWTLTPQTPSTWDGIYTTSIIGTFLGGASTSQNCANTAAGGGAVSCKNVYFDYDIQACSQTPIGNTWNAVAPNCFTDATADNVHTVNYKQSSGGGGGVNVGATFMVLFLAGGGVAFLLVTRRHRW